MRRIGSGHGGRRSGTGSFLFFSRVSLAKTQPCGFPAEIRGDVNTDFRTIGAEADVDADPSRDPEAPLPPSDALVCHHTALRQASPVLHLLEGGAGLWMPVGFAVRRQELCKYRMQGKLDYPCEPLRSQVE